MIPFLKAIDLPVPDKKIPTKFEFFLASIAKIFIPHSNFNTFSVCQTCIDHTFCGKKAKKDFCYNPIVKKSDAINQTIEWIREKYGKNQRKN